MSDTDHHPVGQIPVGISACLLGDPVRYNGGHSQSRLCLDQLSQHFTFYRFCPEVAAGFPIPRPSMRLTGDPQQPVLRYSNNSTQDLTAQLEAGFQQELAQCDRLDGYLLMKNSPSCGMERIRIYQPNGHPHMERGRGLFAKALMARYPLLPVEEEGRLHDSHLRENFVMRVIAHHHYRQQVRNQPSYHNLLQYHSHYKYLLMAHNQHAYRQLGQRLANAHDQPLPELIEDYQHAFCAAVSQPASRGGHCNALQHILGYLKKHVSSAERQSIVQVIEQYQRGEVNLSTPMTLLNHYIQLYGSDYVRAQRYLEPYPAALGLRNQL